MRTANASDSLIDRAAEQTIATLPHIPKAPVNGAPRLAKHPRVRLLGALLGSTLARHRGEQFYTFIEHLRRSAKASRRQANTTDYDAFDELFEQYIARLDQAEQLQWLQDAANAFRLFLTLTQLAESIDAEQPLFEPLPTDVTRWLTSDPVPVRLVATAHPTTIMRKTTLALERQLVNALQTLERRSEPYAVAVQRLSNVIDRMWATRFARWERPRVTDETDQVLGYFQNGILPAYQALCRWVAIEAGHATVPVTYGSWIGGDMDGNPYVSAATFEQTLKQHHRTVLTYYEQQLRLLHDEVTHEWQRLSQLPAVQGWLNEQLAMALRQPWALPMMADWLKREPLRLAVFILHRRALDTLNAKNVAGWPFVEPAELLEGLQQLKTALMPYNAPSRLISLEAVIQQFGFHMASLDLREDCKWIRVATHAVMPILQPDWAALSQAEQKQCLVAQLQSPLVLGEGDIRDALLSMADETDRRFALRLVDMLVAVRQAHTRYGTACCQYWVLSMCQDVTDILFAQLWLKWMGLWRQGRSTVCVVPLFETPDALHNAVPILQDLWHCRQVAGNAVQMVMLGYSDSNKLCGFVTSQWLIYQAQLNIMAAAQQQGITLKFFHGRGGNIGRGGGPNKRAIWSMPAGTCQFGQDVTEQGEVLSRHYNRASTGQAHLLSLLEAYALQAGRSPDPLPDIWHQVMETGSEAAEAIYRELVFHPDFLAYFDHVTPQEVELLPLGSRPSARQTGNAPRSLAQLRAIPWVFRWFQSRQIVPGWFGLGTALHAMAQRAGLAELKAMHKGWPFFETLLFNAALCLQQVDLDIARQYVGRLHGDMAVFELITAEHDRAQAYLRQILGGDLLAAEPRLQASIELKTPYLDPLNYIQVRLLEQYRKQLADPACDGLKEANEQAIMSSIAGIAIGLGTTG